MESFLSNYGEAKKHSVCRVCLNYNSEDFEGKVISVFEMYNNKLICNKINDIVNIDIQEGDGLPDKICFSCVQSLETAYEFKQKCEHSNNILRSAIETGVILYEDLIEEQDVKEEAHNYYKEIPISTNSCNNDDVDQKDELPVIYSEVKQESDIEETKSDEGKLQVKSFQSKAIDLHLECHDCGQFFKSKCKLRVHWKKEHLPSQLTCPSCKKVCKTYKTFHAHMKKNAKSCIIASQIKIVGVGKSRLFYCTQCDYKSKKIYYMRIHWRSHSGERPYSCNICNKSYAQVSTLQSHNELVHKIIAKEGVCKHCGKHIIGRGNYHRHVRSHTALYPCKLCDKVLKSKSSLDNHTRRHSGIKSFTCEVCAKMFIALSELKNHKANVHMKSRIYRCNQCEFSARSHTSMSRHKNRHTGSNIPCIICGKFLENEQQLKIHLARHDKNFECNHCNKRFYSRKNLLAHIRNIHKIRKVLTNNTE